MIKNLSHGTTLSVYIHDCYLPEGLSRKHKSIRYLNRPDFQVNILHEFNFQVVSQLIELTHFFI